MATDICCPVSRRTSCPQRESPTVSSILVPDVDGVVKEPIRAIFERACNYSSTKLFVLLRISVETTKKCYQRGVLLS